MMLYALWFTDLRGERRHIQLRAECREEADKKFKEMELAGLYAKPQMIMQNKEVYVLKIPEAYL